MAIDWFWPGYLAGGPVQSVLSLVQHLGKDINFYVLTTDRDLNSSTPYAGIQTGHWTDSPLGCSVFYCNEVNTHVLSAAMCGIKFDAVYLNSLFSKFFTLEVLKICKREYPNTPVILAPRGMLGQGALNIKKFKKKLFLTYAKLTGLFNKVTWHATSDQEVKEIQTVFGDKASIVCIGNLPKTVSSRTHLQKVPGKLSMCFVSRISLKKNLRYCLQVLRSIREAEIEFNIYGPLEDKSYWQQCEEDIRLLPANIKAKYAGALKPEEIEHVYAGHHALFLPTKNENFGHAIVESLLCGCPVIISDQTPWNDLQSHRAGYALPLSNVDGFKSAIMEMSSQSQEQWTAMSRQSVAYIHSKINLQDIIKQYESLFKS